MSLSSDPPTPWAVLPRWERALRGRELPRPGTGRHLRVRSRRLHLHLIAWWQAPALDRELAAGADPQTRAALAVRARQLTSRRRRNHVASGLARALRRAQDPAARMTAAMRPNAPELLAAQSVLACLDTRLGSRELVTAHGMAMLRTLLTDPSSPLYQPTEAGTLASMLRTASAALTPT